MTTPTSTTTTTTTMMTATTMTLTFTTTTTTATTTTTTQGSALETSALGGHAPVSIFGIKNLQGAKRSTRKI